MKDTSVSSTKLSQWDALQLESLRAQGWTAEELVRNVQEGNLPADSSKFKFDYANLRDFAAAEPGSFEQAVKHGYQIKYNTIRGIHSWILVALGQEAKLDMTEGAEQVIASLTPEEAARLSSVLSFGWQASLQDAEPVADGRAVYRVAPAGGSNG